MISKPSFKDVKKYMSIDSKKDHGNDFVSKALG